MSCSQVTKSEVPGAHRSGFRSKWNRVKPSIWRKLSGTGPVRSLEPIRRSSSLARLPSSVGIEPVRSLESIRRSFSLARLPSSVGIEPVRSLEPIRR